MPAVVAKSAVADVDDKGAFKRKESIFRNVIEEGGKYPPASGRYILYVSYACPWASRCLAYRHIKGLQDVIDLAVVSPVWAQTKPNVDEHHGWVFDPSYPGCAADLVNGCHTVRDLYDLSMENTGEKFDTRYTVPILFDKQTHTIVNNESSEIIRMFNSAFNAFAKHPEIDLAPADLLPAIDAMNSKTYEPICNGVYKCGFAQTQGAYDEAIVTLYAALDEMESIVSGKRYLTGDRATEADIRLFCCLVRFDEVYSVHFKCNKRLIREYPNLLNWMRDLYQTFDLAPTVNMQHIKDHYYRSHPSINPFGIVPTGCDFMKLLDEPYKHKTHN